MADAVQMDSPVKLSQANLGRLPAGVLVPSYDRAQLTPGIVHIGLGNFHRAHQAWYLHRLMQAGQAHDWAIIGAGVRAYDAAMRDRLLEQDCLTTLIELDPSKPEAKLAWSRKGINERKTDALHAMISPPFVREGHVYGIDSYGQMRCLDGRTGDRIWEDQTAIPNGRWPNGR